MTTLRDQRTPPQQFRRTLHEIAGLMSFHVFAHLRYDARDVPTPLEMTTGHYLQNPVPCFLSILRAGNGLVDALSAILPEAAIGHLGVQRDTETHRPVYYYEKLPEKIDQRQVIIADPMLATGGSAVAAINELRRAGVDKIVFGCVIAAPEGIAVVRQKFPEVKIVACSIDEGLNDINYIVPGLGDAGDRYFGTV